MQVAKSTAEAETTPLNNVRERCLRAAAAWQVQVEREERSQRVKAKMAENKGLGLASSA